MGSVECATERIGYPAQGLIQKIHQMPFCTLVLSLWNLTFPCASFSASLPPAPPHPTHMLTYSLFLDGVEGKSESTLMSWIKIKNFLKELNV